MSVTSRFVAWIRAGYPAGVPAPDYQPLMALLRRRLTDDEVRAIAREIRPLGERDDPRTDIGVEITKVTDETPHEGDVDRVLRHLEAHGAPPEAEDDGDVEGGDAQAS